MGADQALICLSHRHVTLCSKLVFFLLTRTPRQEGKHVKWGRDGCRTTAPRVQVRVEAAFWKQTHEPWAMGEVSHTLG